MNNFVVEVWKKFDLDTNLELDPSEFEMAILIHKTAKLNRNNPPFRWPLVVNGVEDGVEGNYN